MPQPQPNVSEYKAESWENESGSVADERLAESLGVVRQMAETYSVGDYHYTNLTDAIAQARRMAKLERELL